MSRLPSVNHRYTTSLHYKSLEMSLPSSYCYHRDRSCCPMMTILRDSSMSHCYYPKSLCLLKKNQHPMKSLCLLKSYLRDKQVVEFFHLMAEKGVRCYYHLYLPE
jgi:hypothetical protein